MSFISWLISENESLTTCQSWQLCLWKDLASQVPLPPQPPSPGPAPSGGSSPPSTAARPVHKQPCPSARNHGLEREPEAGICSSGVSSPSTVRRQKASQAPRGWPHRKLQWGRCWSERSIRQSSCANTSLNCGVYFYVFSSLPNDLMLQTNKVFTI